MIKFMQSKFSISGGRQVSVWEGEVATAETSEFLFSAKGKEVLSLYQPVRNIVTGLQHIDLHFPGTDHKILKKKVTTGHWFNDSELHVYALAALKDNSGNLGKDWDDPFNGDVIVNSVGQSVAKEWEQSATKALSITSFGVSQDGVSDIGPYNGLSSQFNDLNPVWPLHRNKPLKVLVNFSIFRHGDQRFLQILNDSSPVFCVLKAKRGTDLVFSVEAAPDYMHSRTNYVMFSIPAEICFWALHFECYLTKKKDSQVITSYMAGGSMLFTV